MTDTLVFYTLFIFCLPVANGFRREHVHNQWISIALLRATSCGVLSASEPLADQVAAMLAEYDRPDLPGCSLGIIRDGQLIFSRGFGSANLDHEVANTPQTVFEIGSFAKSFTCACLAVLLDQHKIAADDDIRKYLPEMHPIDPPIRIKHMIRCRSGPGRLHHAMNGTSFAMIRTVARSEGWISQILLNTTFVHK